jgi:AcrR family transcriptional regulator
MANIPADRKPRAYSSKLRSRQASETKKSILKAASTLFISRGWEKASISAIAQAAGVSAETVYAKFGNKRSLIKQLVVDAVRRDEPDIPLVEQRLPRAVFAARTQTEQIALFAGSVTEVLTRVAPLLGVVCAAAASEPALARLYRELQSGRRDNIARFVAALADKGPLRHPLDRESATRIVWRLASPELYTLMISVEKTSNRAYADWLHKTLETLLLPEV